MKSKCTIIFVNFKLKYVSDFIYMNDYQNDVSMKDVELVKAYKYYNSTSLDECPF